MSEDVPPMKANTRRTYSTWTERKIPTTYDIAQHRTNYSIGERHDGAIPRLEISPDEPLPEWYRTYREGSAIKGEYPDDFDSWRDPRQLTYDKYNELMDQREVSIETLYEQAEVLERGIEREDDPWLDFQLNAFMPLRYPFHGMQMLASYLAMMAPGSTISTAMAFQATDEIRRQERLARRAAQLEEKFPGRGFTEVEREIWEDHELWQPLRRALEELLTEYDWGKAFVGTNLVLKPLFDELVLAEYSELFDRNDSELYAQVLENFYLDTDRSREVTVSVANHLIEADEENRAVMQDVVDHWYPRCREGIEAFQPAFESLPPEPMAFDEVLSAIDAKYESTLSEASLEVPA